jgi:hypothetical protein
VVVFYFRLFIYFLFYYSFDPILITGLEIGPKTPMNWTQTPMAATSRREVLCPTAQTLL